MMGRTGEFRELADADVMLRVQWGSDIAFAEIYRRYHRRLLDFFYGLSRDAQRAEDLCHETFLRIWQLRVRYKASGTFAAYLFAVARHIWLEQMRQSRKEWRLGKRDDLHAIEELPVAVAYAGPGERASRAEIHDHIFEALGKLPEEQRMAFVMRTVNGLSLEEIAEVMECPINTIRSRRLLAIRRLRELLRGLIVL
jgi:RNA polymerase sigma-70 factor (ECF subfamily)